MNYPVYESKAKYDMWLKVLLGGVVALTFVIGLSEVVWGGEEALTVFGTVLFEIVLYWLILPRRVQITSDKLRIVLGGPLAFNIARPRSKRQGHGQVRLLSYTLGSGLPRRPVTPLR
jgi:hypothetical protein